MVSWRIFSALVVSGSYSKLIGANESLGLLFINGWARMVMRVFPLSAYEKPRSYLLFLNIFGQKDISIYRREESILRLWFAHGRYVWKGSLQEIQLCIRIYLCRSSRYGSTTNVYFKTVQGMDHFFLVVANIVLLSTMPNFIASSPACVSSSFLSTLIYNPFTTQIK